MAASAAARRTPATRIEAARRILDSYVDDEAISSLSTTDFINQLKDGRYLLLSARAIATSRGAKLSMDLVNPGGMGANHRNLELYADICVEHLGMPDSAVINYTDMESCSKVADGLTALRDAVPEAKEESSGGLFPAPHSPVSIPPRMRRVVSESEGTPRVSSPLRASGVSGWASSPAKFVGAVSASVANMIKSPRSSSLQEQTSLRTRLTNSENRIASLMERSERLRNASTESEAQVRTLMQEKEDLEATVATMQASMQQLREETASARADASSNHEELARMEARTAELQRKVDELQERIDEAEDEAMKSRVEAAKQEKLASQARADADAEAARREELEREVASCTAHMQMLEETLQSQAEQQKLAQDAAATSLAEVTARARTRSDRAKALVRQCGSAHSAIRTAAEGMKSLSADVRAQVGAASADLTRMGKQLVEAASRLQTGAAEANRRYMRETKERRRAFNLLQEVRGNIRVFARVRPVLPKEAKRGLEPVVEASSDFELAVGGGDDSAAGTDRGPRSFGFDRVFGAESTQTGVYEEIAPVVMSAMDGFHVCIFAYGQTGSGKTHTMQGCDGHRGVYHRALAQIFEEAASRRDSSDYAISVSMVEIYNETVRDLLAGADSASSSSSSSAAASNTLDIKQGESGVYMPGVTVEPVSDAGAIRSLMARGEKSRSVGRTDANEHSSRSHSLLLIDVMGTSRVNGARTSGRLVLVDLAGSERVSKSGAQGQRMKEAQAINKSLSALGDVIGALTHKTAHVPYRNSKLTYLLQDSLGGDNKALMIVQVSPVAESRSETVCSLNFAARVRKVERGAAKAHSDSGELNKLKAALKEARDQARGLQGALEGAKRDLKELKQRSSKAEEKAKAVEATADRADAAKAAVIKSQRDAKKEAESLKVQLFEAKKAATAEKARADKAAADLAKAKEEAKAVTKEAKSRVSTATRRAKEQAEAGASAAVSRAVSKEKASRAKAVADAAREAKAKARAEATAALEAKVKAAEDALRKEQSRRRALEARVRRGSTASDSVGSRDGSHTGSARSRSRSSDVGSHAPVPTAAPAAGVHATGARARGHAATPARRRSASVTGSAARSVASSVGRSAGHGGTTALLGSGRRAAAADASAKKGSRQGAAADESDDNDAELDQLSDAESDSSDVVSFNVGPASRKRGVTRRHSEVSHASSDAAGDTPAASVAAEEPPPSAEGEPEWPESPVPAAGAPDEDSSAVDEATGAVPAFALNDTFELRKTRGPKRHRGDTSDADGDADEEDEDVIDGFALSDAILQDLEDEEEEADEEETAADPDAEVEDGHDSPQASAGSDATAAAGVSTPGAAKRPAKRTRLGTPAAPSARHAARSGASVTATTKGVAAALAAEAAAAIDDSDAEEEDEFRAASEVFGGAAPAAGAGAGAGGASSESEDADSTRLRFAPQEELNVGTPEQLSQAPQYAARHALGKSPAVRGILKAKGGRRTDPPHAKRPRRAITELSASAPISAGSSAPAAPAAASAEPMPAPARRPRSSATAPPPASAAPPAPASHSKPDAGFGSKSTPALLGSILRSSSRASVILGQSSRSNAQRPLGGARKRILSASSSGTGSSAGRTTSTDAASGRGSRQARAGTSRATRVASSDGSRGRWK